MATRIIRWDSLTQVAWKNGGGVAANIAMEPSMASHDDFEWWVNVATISRSGPFSDFPGVDRDFRVLDGGSVELAVAGHPRRIVTAGGVAYRFPGDVMTIAHLVDQPCRVLNILTRRDRCAVDVRELELTEDTTTGSAGHILVGFIRTGSCSVRADDEWRRLGPFDTFVADEPAQLQTNTGARLILAELAVAG